MPASQAAGTARRCPPLSSLGGGESLLPQVQVEVAHQVGQAALAGGVGVAVLGLDDEHHLRGRLLHAHANRLALKHRLAGDVAPGNET